MTQPLTLGTNGEGAEPTPTILSAKEFAEQCSAIVAAHTGHRAHQLLDQLVTQHLSSLGFGEGMEIFMQNVKDHHDEAKATDA